MASFTGQIMHNLATHTALWSGVGFATLAGGLLGGLGGAVTEVVASKISTESSWDEHEAYWDAAINRFFHGSPDDPLPPEPKPLGMRYVPESRWNNTLLALPGSSSTAIDATVKAIWDAAGRPQRF